MSPGTKAGTGGSVAFDRAAGVYDQTRALSPAAAARVARMLAGELRPRGRILEVGVGSGRMALPLARAGVTMTGIDLAEPMLGRLIANAGGTSPFSLILGDASRLPFHDAAFGGAFACHVLHLIPPWKEVLSEAVRVVRPGGVVLVDWGGWGSGWWGSMVARFLREAGLRREWVGAQSIEEVEQAMRDMGAAVRRLPRIRDQRAVSVDHAVQLLERGVFSFTWTLDEATRRSAAAGVRRWATATFGAAGVSEPRVTTRYIRWRAFDLP